MCGWFLGRVKCYFTAGITFHNDFRSVMIHACGLAKNVNYNPLAMHLNMFKQHINTKSCVLVQRIYILDWYLECSLSYKCCCTGVSSTSNLPIFTCYLHTNHETQSIHILNKERYYGLWFFLENYYTVAWCPCEQEYLQHQGHSIGCMWFCIILFTMHHLHIYRENYVQVKQREERERELWFVVIGELH